METTAENPENAGSASPVGGEVTASLPITVTLRLECRGRRDTRTEWYQVQVAGPLNATLEGQTPFILEKKGEAFGGEYVKRTRLRTEQYDPQERQLLVSHSLPASQATAFALDLKWGFGWERIEAPTAAARPA